MANNPVEDDYIDMDINSATTFLCYTIPSPTHSREFEFQMSSNKLEADHIPSPADELFYKGKLLPLHLPPRLQMVEKLLQNSPTPYHAESHQHSFDNNTSTKSTAFNTPFDSRNISPATSCYVSGELNPEGYFVRQKELVEPHTKKSWATKLKSIKKSSLGLKLKASKAYLKSLFTKPACSDENWQVPKTKESSSRYSKREEMKDDEECRHRSSFSGTTIKMRESNKSSSASSSSSSSKASSFSSVNSNGLYEPQLLKRSSSVNSDNECSIQGAIAYCKKSQQQVCGRKSATDIGFYLLSESIINVECAK